MIATLRELPAARRETVVNNLRFMGRDPHYQTPEQRSAISQNSARNAALDFSASEEIR